MASEYRKGEKNKVDREEDNWEIKGGRGHGDSGISVVIKEDRFKFTKHKVKNTEIMKPNL